MLRYLSIGALMLSSAAAMAEGPSYSYIEGAYQEVDVDAGGGIDADGDGFSVAGSVAINESWFVYASYSSAELESVLDLDRLEAGAGWHSAISDRTDWFVTAGYVDVEVSAGGFGSVSENGIGASIGVRSMLNPKLELSGAVNYSDPEEETSIRAGLWYTVAGNLAIGVKADLGDDVTSYGLGFRLYFDK